jgi:orotate phosphoribosyltransferase
VPDELLRLLAGRQGHFRMESGYHSDQWFDLDHLFDDRARLQPFVSELARRLAAHNIEGVCGPMTGGAKLAELIGREIGVPSYLTKRIETAAPGFFPIKYRLADAQRDRVREKRLAIVDDAISAGSAMRGTYTDLTACGARPVALGALIVFGPASEAFAHEHHLTLDGIAHTSFNLWKPAECPLCRENIALKAVSDT